MLNKTFITNSSAETEELGWSFGNMLKKGSVLALSGDLGSGKTTFIKGLAKGLKIKDRIVSPTFIIQNIHRPSKDLVFYHFDLYRLDKIDRATKEILKESFADPNGISVVEWAEKFDEFPEKTVKLQFEYLDVQKRKIKIHGRN